MLRFSCSENLKYMNGSNISWIENSVAEGFVQLTILKQLTLLYSPLYNIYSTPERFTDRRPKLSILKGHTKPCAGVFNPVSQSQDHICLATLCSL
jgi:hypothetical protein